MMVSRGDYPQMALIYIYIYKPCWITHPFSRCSAGTSGIHQVRSGLEHGGGQHEEPQEPPAKTGDFHGNHDMDLLTLWWTNIAMENHHFLAGKIHYFYGHFPLL